jgi:prepilin-type N-terminal cleavage/methylation domain-containing protein
MRLLQSQGRNNSAFTIVELIVVIAVIGILAGIVIVGYGSWRTSTTVTQVKNDLNTAAQAMENARIFNNGYPTTLPSITKSSPHITLTLATSSTATSYCIDGVSSDSPTNTYDIASATKNQGPLAGTCATRPGQTVPGVPTGLASTLVASTSVSLTWTAGSGSAATSYTAQCASDNAFVSNFGQANVTSTAATVSGLAANGTHYCRVKATNAAGDSPWSSTLTVTTNPYQPPANLATTNITMNSITFMWSSNADATGYTVQCAKDTAFTNGLLSFSVGSATLTGQFNGLTFNTTYYCRINSITAFGASAWSSTVTTATINYYGSLALATSIEGYWTTAPTGYLLEDGSAVSRSTYSDLFAAIGTTYGAGDGSTTFNVPDSRGRTPVNLSSSDAEFNTLGAKYGTKTDIQSLLQLPIHTHIQDSHNHVIAIYSSGNEASGFGLVYGANGFTNRAYVTGGGLASSGVAATNQSTGGSAAHNIIQPSITKEFAIKYTTIDSTAATYAAGTSIRGYWSSTPTGYLSEDGSAVSRTTYATLFSAIGTIYGAGDGSSTFNLPDSRGRAAVDLSSSDAEFNTMGEKYGEKTHTMTINEMPSHTHIQNAHSDAFGIYTSGAEAAGYAMSNGTNGFANRVLVNGGAMVTSSTTATNQNAGSSAPENVIQPSIVLFSAIKYTAATGSTSAVATGTSSEGYWSSVPSGYLAENGSAVSRSTYSGVFAVIGTTYGAGDGSTTFNLPDSRGRLAANISSSDGEFNTMGEKYGEKTHLLTIAEMAAHTHTQNGHNHAISIYTSGSEAGGYGLSSGGNGFGNRAIVGGGGTGTSSTTATNQSTGGGQPFNVIQPSIVKLFIIKT